MDNHGVTVHNKKGQVMLEQQFFFEISIHLTKKSKAQWAKGVHIFCTSSNHRVREEK